MILTKLVILDRTDTLLLQLQKCKILIVLLDNFTYVKYIIKYRFYILRLSNDF